MSDASLLAQVGAATSTASFFILAGWVIRTWPHWKAKVNEARKIQLDADGVLRNDLFRRIRELEETQSADRLAFNNALSDERRRCDAELDAIRLRLAAAEDENRGLKAMISQNSQSTAQMLGRPDSVVTSKAKRDV